MSPFSVILSSTRRQCSALGLTHDPLLALVALLAVLLPLVPAGLDSRGWHGAKTLTFELGAALLLGALPWSQRRVRMGGGQGRAPGALFFFLLLALWAGASFVAAVPKAFALNGWWQIAGGLVVTYTVATRARGAEDDTFLRDALAVAGVIVSLATFALYPSGGGDVAAGPYHDHALLGAALMILLPVTVAGGVSSRSSFRKTAALVASALCAAALLLTQTRSAWIGAVAAIVLFGALSLWRTVRMSRGRRHGVGHRRRLTQGFVYAALVCIAVAYAFTSSPDSLLAARAHTLFGSVPQGREESVEWRLRSWRGAWRMFHEKPLTGWGVGTYPYYQHTYTGQGEPVNAVDAAGPTIPNEAHNSYLQLAVELGVPGPALWVLVIGAAFCGGLRALSRLPDGSPRQWVLIGGLSSLAGYAVDAFASPAWQFGEVNIYLWIILGLVLAASSDLEQARGPGLLPAPVRIAAGLAACALCVWLVLRLAASAPSLPVPHL